MNRREKITLFTTLVLLTAVVLAGFPSGRKHTGSTGSFPVLADATTATPVPTTNPKATATPTPVITTPPVFKSVSAYYTGPAVVVGDEIDFRYLQVYAMFDDGSAEKLEKDDYILSGTVVTKEGTNKLVAIYNGSTQTFYVQGKKMTMLTASTTKMFYGFNNSLDPDVVSVTAFYSDGSVEEVKKNYGVSPAAFKVSGTTNVTIFYRGMTDSFSVYVNEAKPIKTLSVTYSGDTLIQDQKINRDDLKVMVVYNDETFSTEKINNYEMAQESFTSVGDNELIVSFMGATAKCKIPVKAKTIVSMTAKYTGDPIEIGGIYSDKDLHVYLNYNDDTQVEIKDYAVYDSTIRYLGDNTIRIYYGDYTTSVKIEGIEELPVDFSYVSEFSIRSGANSFTITTAIPKRLEPEAIKGKLVKKTKLTRAFKRLKSKNGWYCGFNFDFEEFSSEAYLPLTIRLTVPDDMEPEYTEIYYTPDLKNIVATMNKEIIDDNTIETTLFSVGAYMIVYDPDAYIPEPLEDEDEETKDEDSMEED